MKANDNDFKMVHNRKNGREGFNMNRKTDIHNGKTGKIWNDGRNVNENNKWKRDNRVEYWRRKEARVHAKKKK